MVVGGQRRRLGPRHCPHGRSAAGLLATHTSLPLSRSPHPEAKAWAQSRLPLAGRLALPMHPKMHILSLAHLEARACAHARLPLAGRLGQRHSAVGTSILVVY